MNANRRIKYNQGNGEDHILINLDQSFDFLEILSLKLSQNDVYKTYTSNYGVLIGRVIANDGFGIPNAKISIFVPKLDNNDIDSEIIYPYETTSDKNVNNVRYNLLPQKKINRCHQNVGTMPTKRDVLDNDINIDIFDNYYTYTTVTNESGDYMLFGVPVGSQNIHVDIDLSDIGVLSQTPRDLIYKGYGVKQFDSPNKFKKSTNLDSLAQIISQDTTVYIYPFWGDDEQSEIAITKKDINIQYKFEPTCVFMGSIFTDSSKSGISKTCKPSRTGGKMSELMTSQGTIEMIRETPSGKIERFDISGGALINGDGVWCYQIPMNLDYIITDEYGNIVPTTDSSKGMPTRSNVRFRITLNDNGGEFNQDKTGVYLVPNMPIDLDSEDYEFGVNTNKNSMVNLMWNKVYSVKNYIPRTQKSRLFGSMAKDRRFIGLKSTNYHEANNPVPYNNIWIDINLKFLLTCLITTLFIDTVAIINDTIHFVNKILDKILIGGSIDFVTLYSSIGGDPCEYFGTFETFAPVNNSYWISEGNWEITKIVQGSAEIDTVKGCVETNLSSDNEVVNFDFTNDWINGALYAPRFLTKTKRNRKTGKTSTSYCGSWYQNYNNLYINQTCAVGIDNNGQLDSETVDKCQNKNECYEKHSKISIGKGNISKFTSSEEDVFYYRSVEFPGKSNGIKYFHPTGIILLGGLLDCDLDGIPKLHRLLPQTSFKLPPDTFEGDDSILDWYGNPVEITESTAPQFKTMSGVDWGNDSGAKYNGLFVAVGCTDSDTIPKTCINASRLCEIGVDFDEKYIGSTIDGIEIEKYIDGHVSYDEISDGNVRAMFATLNHNNLKTIVGENSMLKYDFSYKYPDGFDGRLRGVGVNDDLRNLDYYKFKFGKNETLDGYDYLGGYSFPRYENSFYFYFGLKPGLTAIDIFNNQYYIPCAGVEEAKYDITLRVEKKCNICDGGDGAIAVEIGRALLPYVLYLNDVKVAEDIYFTGEYIITGMTAGLYTIKTIDREENVVTYSITLPTNLPIVYTYETINTSSYEALDGVIIVSNIINYNNNEATSYSYTLKLNGSEYRAGIIENGNVDISNLGVGQYILTVYETSCIANKMAHNITITSTYESIFNSYYAEQIEI